MKINKRAGGLMTTTCKSCGREVSVVDVNAKQVCVMCQRVATNTVSVDAQSLIFFNKKTCSWHEHPLKEMTMEDLKLLMQIVQSEMFERTHGHHPDADSLHATQPPLLVR
jgi:hypothetical protein